MATPGLAPPPGVTPNFINPESHARFVVVTHTICLTLSTIFVLLRTYTKFFISHAPGWEDYTSLIAWVGSVAYSVIGLMQVENGLGVHQWNVPLEKAIRYIRFSNVEQILYSPLMFFVKASILLLYYRIFNPKRAMKYAILFMGIFLLLFYTANALVKIFLCSPRERIWDKRVPGRCLNLGSVFMSTAIVNVLSDFYILVLPLPSVWNLRLPLPQKLGLTATFSAGLFACIASIIRMVETIRHKNEKDQTWNLLPIVLWTVAETHVGIICGCLPILPSFFRRYFSRRTTFKGSYPSERGNNTAHSRATVPTARLAVGVDGTHDALRAEGVGKGKYVELDEVGMLNDALYIGGTASSVSADGRAADAAGYYDDSSAKEMRMEDGIIKSVDVEQSVTIKDR